MTTAKANRQDCRIDRIVHQADRARPSDIPFILPILAILSPLSFAFFSGFPAITRSRSGHDNVRGDPSLTLVSRVRDLLHEHFREPLSLAELAVVAGVHPSHLAREFRAHHGMAIGEYVRRLRCDWAVARLLATTESISEVATGAGYSDQSHFTRQCVRFFGVGPGQYRRTHGS